MPNRSQMITKLSPSEVAQGLDTSAEYKVTEVADRNAGIVLKINKERLDRGITLMSRVAIDSRDFAPSGCSESYDSQDSVAP